MPPKPEYVTMAGLKARGWTQIAIVEFLGRCDRRKTNPHYRTAPKIQLYLKARVEAAENSDEYKQFVEMLEECRTRRAI